MYLLWVTRIFFVLLAYLVGLGIKEAMPEEVGASYPFLMAALAVSLVILEIVFQRHYLRTLVAFFLGLLVGVGITFVIGALLKLLIAEPELQAYVSSRIVPIAGLFFTYLCVTIVLQTKDQFRFILPYVDFSKQGPPTGGYLLDTSAIIDGRIIEIHDSGVLNGSIIIPEFIVHELQEVADSADRIKRERGRRGLDLLKRLQENHASEIVVRPGNYPDIPDVDGKLIRVAQETDTRLVTTDSNLARVARVENVGVIDIRDLVCRLHLVINVGDEFAVELVRAGEAAGQAVGFLEDDTMVVVENAAAHIGTTMDVGVARILHTAGGRMVFAKPSHRQNNTADPAPKEKD
ncbi:MAG: hypothetical protein JW909_04320 [Planctomycetes bacterium]|nr:hypothetical protein [Planctomycetota bacterium]